MPDSFLDIGRHWKAIMDTVNDGLLIIDKFGKIIAVNPAAERMTGYSEAELKEKDCRVLNCTGCVVYARGPGKDWCKLFAKGQVRDKKCLLTHKDRRTVHLLKSGTVLKDADGEIVGVVETLTDITREIRHQQEIKCAVSGRGNKRRASAD